jgi:hypothetical protein
MELIDWIIIGVAAVAVVGIIISLICRKKKGKNGCGCGCAGCQNSVCPSAQKKEEKK